MELPSLFSSTQPDSARKLFIAILITGVNVQSSLWEVVDNSVVILERSDIRTYKDIPDLLVKTDACLQDLGKESENIDEVIFGLEPDWVSKEGILNERKPILKKITDELSLKAVGYVVTVEALLHHLVQIQPGQSVILLQIDSTDLNLSLLRQGKVIGTKKVGRSDLITADITEALARFKTEGAAQPLPLKMLLFSTVLDNEALTTEEQGIINYDWVASGLFLQPPIVELLPPNLLLDVVTREGGTATAKSLNLIVSTPGSGDPVSEGLIDQNVEPVETPSLTDLPTSFGIPIKPPESNADDVETAMINTVPTVIETASLAGAATALTTDEELAVPSSGPTTKFWQKIKFPKLPALPKKLGGANSWGGSHKKFILAGFGAGVIVLLLAGYLFLFLTTKAVATLDLNTNTIAQQVSLKLDPNQAAVDTTQLILPAQVVTQDVTGTDSTGTTGNKLVGDPAKGTVTISNKTTAPKTFAKGTTLTSGKLKFTLDSDVNVASASVTTTSDGENKTFGKADAGITAAAIGTDSNLGKNTDFTIATFDSNTYSANNAADLAGGASREVRVVSAEDKQRVLAELKQNLIKDAATKFKTSMPAGTYVIPTGKITTTQEDYSAKVGDETNQLTLNLAGAAEGLAYHAQDLQPISQAVLQSQVPSGYELLAEQPEILSTPEPVSSASAQVVLSANISSKVRPVLDLKSLQDSIAGKPIGAAEKIISEHAEIKNVTFTFTPAIAEKILSKLPPASRLQIVIK